MKAEKGRFAAKLQFDFMQESKINKMHYRYKTIEAIFADEPMRIVVVTVKVYYNN